MKELKFSVTKSRGNDLSRCFQGISQSALSTAISLFFYHESLRGRSISGYEYETTVILLTCENGWDGVQLRVVQEKARHMKRG